MSFVEISSLRPKKNDSASISKAIAQAAALREAKSNKAEDLRRQRASALLTATDAQMAALEDEIAIVERDGDRISALLTVLAEQQKAAVASEAMMVLRAEGEAVAACAAALNKELQAEYPEIVRRLADFAQRHEEAYEACKRYQDKWKAAPASLPVPSFPLMFRGELRTGTLKSMLLMPALEGTQDRFCSAFNRRVAW